MTFIRHADINVDATFYVICSILMEGQKQGLEERPCTRVPTPPLHWQLIRPGGQLRGWVESGRMEGEVKYSARVNYLGGGISESAASNRREVTKMLKSGPLLPFFLGGYGVT